MVCVLIRLSCDAIQKIEKKQELDDPQTIADIRSQQLIFSSLLNTFPGLPIVAEEDSVQVATQVCTQCQCLHH